MSAASHFSFGSCGETSFRRCRRQKKTLVSGHDHLWRILVLSGPHDNSTVLTCCPFKEGKKSQLFQLIFASNFESLNVFCSQLQVAKRTLTFELVLDDHTLNFSSNPVLPFLFFFDKFLISVLT